MSYELLNLLLLVIAQVLFSDFVGAEHFHQTGNIFDQNIVTCYHDLLIGGSGGAACGLSIVSSSTLAGAMAFSRFGWRFVGLSGVVHFLLVPTWHVTLLWGV